MTNRAFNHESEHNLLQIITDNSAFSTGIFVFSYLIIAAVIFSSQDITLTLKNVLSGWEGLPILLVLLLPLVAGLLVFIKTVDTKK